MMASSSTTEQWTCRCTQLGRRDRAGTLDADSVSVMVTAMAKDEERPRPSPRQAPEWSPYGETGRGTHNDEGDDHGDRSDDRTNESARHRKPSSAPVDESDAPATPDPK